jgi:Na+/H+ antiporter NhaA
MPPEMKPCCTAMVFMPMANRKQPVVISAISRSAFVVSLRARVAACGGFVLEAAGSTSVLEGFVILLPWGNEHGRKKALHFTRMSVITFFAIKIKDIIDPKSTMSRCYKVFEPISAFLVVPIFSFANSGVAISLGTLQGAIAQPVFWGIVIGLFVGKPLGIFGFSWVAVKAGLAQLHKKLNWNYLLACSIITGIGFKLALVLARLAFAEQAPQYVAHSKMAIIIMGITMAIIGQTYLFRFKELPKEDSVAGMM